MENIIPVGHKFALISLGNASVDIGDQPIHLSHGISIYPNPPLHLDDSWKESLGTFQYEAFSESNFIIIITSPSDTPGILDQENEDLLKSVDFFFLSLLLHGVPFYEEGLRASGENVGEPRIRSVGPLNTYYRTASTTPLIITPSVIQSARDALNGLFTFYSEVGYHRLTRGFNAWTRGLGEILSDERNHQFVRAIEALIKPQIGKTKKQFINRCQHFIDANKEDRIMLAEIFDLRSATEHMNDWSLVLGHVSENERSQHAILRTYQADVLARSLYLRICSSNELQSSFLDDKTIDQYWAMPQGERQRIWGEPITLPSQIH